MLLYYTETNIDLVVTKESQQAPIVQLIKLILYRVFYVRKHYLKYKKFIKIDK